MARKIKDTDYLNISAWIRAVEKQLLSRLKLERLISAPADEEAYRVLSECGYGEFHSYSQSELEEALAKRRENFFSQLSGAVPDEGFMEYFKIKYDYHNAKALLKAQAMGADAERLLSGAGRIPKEELQRAVNKAEYGALPDIMGEAVVQARELLARERDPQAMDFLLDRACAAEQLLTAEATGCGLLTDYARLSADAANLRSALRAARMKKTDDLLSRALIPGGSVSEAAIAEALKAGKELSAVFAGTPLTEAALLADTLKEGGSLTAFERLCDETLSRFLSRAGYVAFGPEPLIAYIAALENELTAVRIVMSGRKAGLKAEAIRERLRESYV